MQSRRFKIPVSRIENHVSRYLQAREVSSLTCQACSYHPGRALVAWTTPLPLTQHLSRIKESTSAQ